MTRERTAGPARTPRRESMVWIDHREALILTSDKQGADTVAIVEREPSEAEAEFDTRAAEEVAAEERVVVAGPAYARTQFERAYVALTHRPDRLIDVEPKDRTLRVVR